MIGLLQKLLSKKYRKSYSQCGEDLLIQYIFILRGIKNPTYIDIGANDPYYLSNTALFYKKGSRGVNIEANPSLHQKFMKHRSADINLNIGISSSEDELDFYIMEDDTLSTFSKTESDNMQAQGNKLREIKKVKLQTVDQVIRQHCNGKFPDFLSIDVEGMDFDILRSIDFSVYRPKVICVEAAEYSPIGAGERRSELIDFLASRDYYEYANTNLNAIMVDRKFWFI
jgi:FkbM family methyltransferase